MAKRGVPLNTPKSKCQKQRDRKRQDKILAKDQKKTALTNVLASLTAMEAANKHLAAAKLVSSKTFDLKRATKQPRAPKPEDPAKMLASESSESEQESPVRFAAP